MTKTLVIGLDGADFDILDPMFEADRMPNLRGVAESGVRGPLTSTIPPSTCPGWQAFYTGRSPGNIGTYGFKNFTRDSYEPEVPDSSDLAEPTFWEILGEEGMKTGLIGGPFTYPAQSIDGFTVSGPWTPSTAETFTYPPKLSEEIRTLAPEYTFIPETYEVDRFKPMFRQRTDVSTHLLSEREWDVCTVVYRPDPLQHVYWGKDNEKVFEVYEYMDKCIGEVLETVAALDEQVNIFVMSDHGFEGIRSRYFNVNQWLREQGYLSLKSGTGSLLSVLPLEPLLAAASTLGVLGAIKSVVPFAYQERIRNPLSAVEWGETKAFFQFEELTGQVYINRRSRFPDGTVAPEAVPETKRDIARRLRSVQDPQGRQIVTDVWTDTELYPGMYTDLAPDLSFALHPEYKGEGKFGELYTELDDNRAEGGHSRDGIFFASGPDIGTGELDGAEIVDLAPTILHIMEAPVEAGMDGEVLWDIYAAESPHLDREVREVEQTRTERETADWEEKQRQEVRGRLEDLGYM